MGVLVKTIITAMLISSIITAPGAATPNTKNVQIVDMAGDFCLSGEEIIGIATTISVATDIPVNLIVVPGKLPWGQDETSRRRATRFNQILAKSFLSGRIPIMLICGLGEWSMDGPIHHGEDITYNRVHWNSFPLPGSEARVLIPGLEFMLEIPF